MRRLVPGLVTAAAFALPAAVALAQPGPQASAPPTAAGGASIVRYGRDFFADNNPKTALDMVNLLPGFTFSAGDTSVRGYTGAVGNVLIDGQRPAAVQFTLDQVLQRIPAEEVDYIEVIRGNAPGIEMLNQTVVANVVRKKTAADSLTVTASDAVFRDGRTAPTVTVETARHFSGGRSFTGAASVSRYVELAEGDGPEVRRDATGGVLDRVEVKSAAGGYNAYAYGVFSAPLWAGRLNLDGSLSRTDYTYRETDRTTAPAPAVSQLGQYLGGPLGGQLTGELGAHFNRSFGRKWTSESVLLVDFKDQSYKSSLLQDGGDELFEEHDRGGETLARSDWRYAATPGLTAEFSLEGAYNTLHTSSLFAYAGFPVALPNARAAVSEAREEAAAKVVWAANRTVQLEVGARIETSTIWASADVGRRKTLSYPKPRLVLTITPDAKDQLQFRIEREVGQLDFTNFVAASALDTNGVHAGNIDIVPQQSWTLEATFERRFWSQGDLNLTYRRYLISDAIDRVPIRDPLDPASAFDAPGNIGLGVQDAVIANLTLPLDRLGVAHGLVRAQGTFQSSKVTDPTTGARRPITGVEPAEYAISFRQTFPRTGTAWGASFATACAVSTTAKGCTTRDYRFDEVDRYRADGVLDLYVEWQARADTLLRLEADNVLGARYDRVVDLWPGPRDALPLAYSDSRTLTSSPSILLSLRRTF